MLDGGQDLIPVLAQRSSRTFVLRYVVYVVVDGRSVVCESWLRLVASTNQRMHYLLVMAGDVSYFVRVEPTAVCAARLKVQCLLAWCEKKWVLHGSARYGN